MPAESEAQRRWMGMALRYKRTGVAPSGMDAGATAQLKATAEDMSEATLREFATRRRRGKTALTR